MTFDLEKARASDEALPYPLDAKEIWISGKGQMHINPPNEPSIFFTLSDLCEFRNLFHGQAAEIERVRAELASANVELLAAGELVTQLKRVREAEIDQAGAAERIYLEGVRAKDARIQELEDALAEERAKVIMLIEKLQLVANDPDWQSKGLKHDFDWYLAESKKEIESGEPEDQRCRRLGEPNGWTDPEGKIGPDVNEKQSDELVAAYREMRDLARCAPGSAMHRKAIERYDALRAEGKIGPDAKPRSWQITDERIRAIQWAEEMAGDCKAGDVLRAMLKEAGQE